MNNSKYYDKVYTIGCFDFCHQGHINLLNNLKKYGKNIIVGIHDDISIRQLKNLNSNQHNKLSDRIKKIKPYCNRIFVIPDKDPSDYINAFLDSSDNFETSVYIRAADNINFPGKHIIENKMNIIYLPYTDGISATQIRKNLKL
tara:strand:- start:1215 stop:1646 length:432 start_codon:yes stop_codon:yes gene_type:complete